jgi:hypothetical protein
MLFKTFIILFSLNLIFKLNFNFYLKFLKQIIFYKSITLSIILKSIFMWIPIEVDFKIFAYEKDSTIYMLTIINN